MSATKEAVETWLSAMPAIPDALVRGCPVVHVSESVRAIVWSRSADGGVRLADDHATDSEDGSGRGWRIDLDSPIGFSVALRWLWSDDDAWVADPVLRHWLRGETTDRDRLALAWACADVIR